MDKKELNNLIDRISLTGPEGTKKIKKVLKELSDESGGLSQEEVEAYVEQALTQFGSDLMTVNRQSLLGPGNIDACMVETTWQELKDARDNGELVPGALYRITDYATTTVQEDTRSAGHQFDIIVQALSESVLSEDAKAIQHEVSIDNIPKYCMNDLYNDIATLFGTVTVNDVVYYSYRNSFYEFLIDINNLIDGGIDSNNNYPGYPYVIFTNLQRRLNAEEYVDAGDGLFFSTDIKELFYFSNSNLAAWKLKYCLDNDEERFVWARGIYLSPITHNKFIRVGESNAFDEDSYIYVRQPQLDNENGLAWAYDDNDESGGASIKEYVNNGNESLNTNDIIYTQSENVYIGQVLDMDGTPVTVIDFSENQGKGVIYQMIDDYNNDCPYDFKNIQFLRRQQFFDQYGDFGIDVIGDDYDIAIHKYYYTFTQIDKDFNIIDASIIYPYLLNDDSEPMGVYNNVIKNCKKWFGMPTNNRPNTLNNIVIISSYNITNEHYFSGIINNTFEEGCYNITCGNKFLNNIIGKDCIDIVIQNDCERNIIDSGCNSLYIHNSFMNCKFDYTASDSEISNNSSEAKISYIMYSNYTGYIQMKHLYDAFS